MTWEEYENKLARHDWTACMSDSYAVTLRGEAAHKQLMIDKQEMAKLDPEKAEYLYKKARAHGWGEPFPEEEN